jgi:hypothetical protein
MINLTVYDTPNGPAFVDHSHLYPGEPDTPGHAPVTLWVTTEGIDCPAPWRSRPPRIMRIATAARLIRSRVLTRVDVTECCRERAQSCPLDHCRDDDDMWPKVIDAAASRLGILLDPDNDMIAGVC